MRQKFFAGTQIRRLRESHGLTQASFAERLAISASYLNQIENNQRPVTAPVLLALAQSFSLNLTEFTQEDTEHLLHDLREALADPVFASITPNGQDLKAIAANIRYALPFLPRKRRRRRERSKQRRGRVRRPPALLRPLSPLRGQLPRARRSKQSGPA